MSSAFEMRPLGELCQRTSVWSPEKEPRSRLKYVDVSAVSSERLCIVAPQELAASDAPSRARKIIRTDDTIFATIRPTLARIALVPPALDGELASTAFCVIRPRSEELLPKFAYFAVQSEEFVEAVARHERGASYPAVRDKDILGESIPLPKPDEQRKIAAVLGKVQAAVEVEGELIRVTRELKQAALRQLFTRGLRGEPQKQTDLGPVLESWDIVPLGTLFETQLGKMLSPKAKQGETPLPYLRNKNVQWGRIELDDVLTMDFDAREKVKFRLKPGDLLICEGGIVGRCAIWRGQIEECYYQKALHRVRPLSDESSNEFLAYWFEHAFQFSNLYRLGGANSTIVHLPEVQLLRLQIPKPDHAEQREIAGHLAAIDAKLAHHEARQTLLRELFRTLLRDLLTARRRVTSLALPTT